MKILDNRHTNHNISWVFISNLDQRQPTILMECMIRFTQTHETFRLAEIRALAVLENIDLEVLSYSPSVSDSFLAVEFSAHPQQVAFLLREVAI